MVWREILAVLKANEKWSKISETRRSHAHQNWFACISHQPLLAWIFWANSIFWPPWTIVHGSKGNFLNKISETWKAHSTKIGLHAFHINLYLLWIFWANSIFWEAKSMAVLKGNFGKWRSHNSETGIATPTKIGLHAFQVNFYLHEFFEPILFFDPHGL